MILTSRARGPGGFPVAPPDNADPDRVLLLLVAAAAVLAVGFLLLVLQRNRPSGRWATVCLMIGTSILIFHPVWTVPADGLGGDTQVLCSWVVLGIEVALVGVQLALLLWRADAGSADRTDYDDQTEGN